MNTLIDTLEYKAVLEDRSSTQYADNIMAENMFSQTDSKGDQFSIISEIADRESDNLVIKILDGYIQSKNGNLNPKIPTRR